MSNLSDSNLGKTIQKSTVSFIIYIHWEYLTTQLDPRWTMKLQHLQTIQTCHCHRMSGTWHLPSNRRSIQWGPPHTRPWRPRHQSGSLSNWCLRQRRLSSVPRPRPGGSDRLRLASRSWFLPSKPDYWNPTNNSHSTERYRICLIQNLKKQSPFSIYIFADNSTRSEMNDETIQHLQTIQTCHCHRMSGTWHLPSNRRSIQWSPPHTTPWRSRRQSGLVPNRCLRRTHLSSAPRPRPGNIDRSRLASSSSRALPFKMWSLKSGEHMTFNSDMWISLIKNLANNPEINSCLQHLHISQLALNRDEWWNYRTSKPSKLVTVTGCRESMGKWHHDMPPHSAKPIPHTRPWPLGTNLVLF